MLLDIGAGQGLFSIAAAARGHRAIAFELSPNSLASFEASMAFNGFQDLITLHKVPPTPPPMPRWFQAQCTHFSVCLSVTTHVQQTREQQCVMQQQQSCTAVTLFHMRRAEIIS